MAQPEPMHNPTQDTVNVIEIMEGIRNEIREKGLSNDMLSFEDIPIEPETESPSAQFDTDVLHDNTIYIKEHARFSLPSSVSTSGFFNRTIHQYVGPILQWQGQFNEAEAEAMEQIERYIHESRTNSMKELIDRIETLELQQKNARLLIQQQQAEMIRLQEQLDRQKGETS